MREEYPRLRGVVRTLGSVPCTLPKVLFSGTSLEKGVSKIGTFNAKILYNHTLVIYSFFRLFA